MGSRLRLLPVLLASLLASGCIATQSNDAREFARFPPEALAGGERFPLDVRVTAQATGVSADNQLRATLLDDVRNAYVFHLNRTERVRPADDDAPAYRAQVAVYDRGGDSGNVAAAVLTIATLYLVPSWTTHHYETRVEVFAPDGRSLGRKRYRHRLRLVQQLFLVFGMPFASLQQSYDEMWSEVMRDAAAWTVETVQVGAR